MIVLIFVMSLQASDLPGEELFSSGVSEESKPESRASLPKGKKQPKKTYRVNGNLPKEYTYRNKKESTKSVLLQVPAGSSERFRGLIPGDEVNVLVSHSVIAFPDEKTPVVGQVMDGMHRGIRLVGEASLESNTKRIFVEFKKVISKEKSFATKALGLSESREQGLDGEYHSREMEYFGGDFLASFSAGYFDGLIPRRANIFGQLETTPTVENAVKSGLASSSLSTANRFRDKLKKVPEFSELKGPFRLKVVFLDDVKATN